MGERLIHTPSRSICMNEYLAPSVVFLERLGLLPSRKLENSTDLYYS